MTRVWFDWLVLAASCLGLGCAYGADIPKVVKWHGGAQLMVHEKPYLILGGELGNSSAGTAAQADSILPRLAQMHVNTVLMPVAWEQIEPTEGQFDFSILDHWIDAAREQHMHLVLLWFGSWKNAFSNYAPGWVKENPKRFPRAISADGNELEILSTLGEETQRSDARAFSTLMKHVREKDGEQQTVLMVQVENEVGYLGRGRDRSAAANRLFQGAVPSELMRKLIADRDELSPELRAVFNAGGHTWSEAFGSAADEAFMAWNYARFIEAVTEAGKRAYSLPMYVNCQLPAPHERAGEYPSGGPHPYSLAVYRAAAPAIDFYSPDIYWPNFEYWIDRYRFDGNAVFVPEARADVGAYNALYAYGQAKAFGFSPFGVDSLPASPEAGPSLKDTYAALSSMSDIVLQAQSKDETRAMVLHKDSPRATQTAALGGYLFEGTLSRSWPARALETDHGAMMIVQTGEDEFYVVGSGLTVSVFRDPDVDEKVSGIASIEEVTRVEGEWKTLRRLNGDQSNQGRQLQMSANQVAIYRVRLYAVDRALSTR